MTAIRDRVKELRRVKAKDLIPNPQNWRTHPKPQRAALRGVLEELGYAGALVARETPNGLELIDGHLRAETTPDMEVPVLVVDLDDHEANLLLASMDPLAAMAQADKARLDAVLRKVDTGNAAIQEMLADLAEKNKLYLGGEVEEDEVPEPPAEPITKPGDLWALGEHRLLCGDSTRAEDVGRVLNGTVPFIMVTDPPYGVEYDPEVRSTAKSRGRIENDDRASWSDAWRLFQGDVAYVWHASLFTDVVLCDLESCGLKHVSMIIWNKPYATFSMANYHWKHEPCWYCVRNGGSRKWVGSPKEATVWEMTQPKDPYGRSGEATTPHPTQKPVEAMARPIRNHGGADDDVYDPFLGSGTTLIAAEQLGRRCYGLEIAPQYCDVIVERWENLTGKKAVRE